MAENKKSFILYADMIHTVEKMPKGKRADLFMAILEYVNDRNPVVKDIVVDLVFEPIKRQLKRDLSKWSETKEVKSTSGAIGNLKRWNPDLHEQVIKEKITLEKALEIAKRRKAIKVVANVAVNDTVTVNVTDTVKEREKEIPLASFKKNDLSNSNLFRQPKIPELENVRRAFFSAGGSEDMAQSFFDKYQATGWFLKGSPITNFTTLIPSYISNWTKNESRSTSGKTNSTERFATRVNNANRYSENGTGRQNDP